LYKIIVLKIYDKFQDIYITVIIEILYNCNYFNILKINNFEQIPCIFIKKDKEKISF